MTIIDLPVTNGVTQYRGRGRAVPARLVYTFQDSGVTVEMNKMSPMTVTHLKAEVTRECEAHPPGHPHAKPQVPVQLVAVGGGEPIPQTNEGDTEYKNALAEWDAWANAEISRRLLRITALDYLIIDDDAIVGEVDRKRRMFVREGIPLDESDMPEDRYTDAERNRIVYLNHICFGSDKDIQEFSMYLMHRTQPQEAGIGDAIAAFRAADE